MTEPEPSKQDADAAWARALFGPKRDSFLAAAFGLEQAEPVHHEEPPQGEPPPPDFDGGVREPFIETDAVADHNEFVMDLFRNTPSGGGGQW